MPGRIALNPSIQHVAGLVERAQGVRVRGAGPIERLFRLALRSAGNLGTLPRGALGGACLGEQLALPVAFGGLPRTGGIRGRPAFGQ